MSVISWQEAYQQAQNLSIGPCPPQQQAWYAYKQGVVLGKSTVSGEDASARFGPCVVEHVIENHKAINAWKRATNSARAFATDLWYESLREYYKSLDDNVFAECYDYAYERQHHNGNDAVTEEMRDVVAFAEAIIAAAKGSLTRFAALVRAQTLEEAAGVCDNSASHCHDDGLLQVVLKSNAAAIRALKLEGT